MAGEKNRKGYSVFLEVLTKRMKNGNILPLDLETCDL